MINVSDLHKDQETRNDIKRKTFDKILEDLSRVIKNRSLLGQKECFLNVPAFVIGKPLYNVRQATKYVIYRMRKNGFQVYDGGGNEIYVSWRIENKQPPKKKEPSYNEDEDDFMLPSFANLEKKCKSRPFLINDQTITTNNIRKTKLRATNPKKKGFNCVFV